MATREPITSSIISMEGEKNEIPVEVAMVYNNSYAENLHSYVNNTIPESGEIRIMCRSRLRR